MREIMSSSSLTSTNPSLSSSFAPSVQSTSSDAVSQTSDLVAQLSLGSEKEASVQLNPKDHVTISKMVSKVAGDLSKLDKAEQSQLQKVGRDVETLILYKLTTPPPTAIVENLVTVFPCITGLRIEKANDETLKKLQALSSSLKTLTLTDCEDVTNSGMRALRVFKDLRNLSMRKCTKVSTGIGSLASLTELTKLSIEGCKLTVENEKSLVDKFMLMKELKKIKINGEVEPETLAATLLQSHPTLHTFNKYSYRIHTDETFLQLLKTLRPDTREFVATGCCQVSASSVITLIRSFPHLEKVTLHNCTELDPRPILQLIRVINKKQQIQIFGCKRFDELAMVGVPLEGIVNGKREKVRAIGGVVPGDVGFVNITKEDDKPCCFLTATSNEQLILKAPKSPGQDLVQADEEFEQYTLQLDMQRMQIFDSGDSKR